MSGVNLYLYTTEKLPGVGVSLVGSKIGVKKVSIMNLDSLFLLLPVV